MSYAFSRRTALAGSVSIAAVAGLGGLTGCSSSKSDQAVANAKVTLPSYRPLSTVKPDLPGDDVILDGFLSYPADPRRSVQGTMGDGKPITFMTNIPGAIPPSVDKNAFWQQLNDRLGSELQISMSSNDEYPKKFATRIAGDDLPDILNIPTTTPQLPALVKAKCVDLTEQLSGDAIKKYPNLANLPTEAWRGCVFNGAIYGVPVVRLMSRTSGPLYREDLLAEHGITDPAPKDFAAFRDICVEMTDTKRNRWSWAVPPTNYVKQMLGIGPGWTEKGGTFTHANESDKVPQALEAVRTMYADNLINPDALTSGASAQKEWFGGGIVSFVYDSYVAWNQFYADNTSVKGFEVNMLDVPGFDGGDGTPWMGAALNNLTAFTQGSDHKIDTLLALADWMAAPFGTEEYLFRKYGVPGTDFSLQGSDPVPNAKGVLETGIGLQYICDSRMALYLAGKPEVPKKQQQRQRSVKPRLVRDESYGLYSETMSKTGPTIDGTLNDLQTQIIAGRKPVSAWKQGVQDWLAGGGERIRAELQKAHADVAG
ncbi:extracellular solute-binding protein [Microlunatus soli]|uniref:Putative aldouronate transport system substrate-binding protein n=1 Tax=Microlunatus soli TaxID=630515 RepID=A0A1H1YJV1_9ACTN|nr:extracellular solute-binding protein [Microlunatus soli]SDT21641.1 putative aldouronate transport system substrate-binding protein [Microlunatus soli]